MSPPGGGDVVHNALGTVTPRGLNLLTGVATAATITAAAVGMLVAPSPWTHTTVKGTKCVAQQDLEQEWFWPSGTHKCHSLPANDSLTPLQHNVSLQNIVFAFQFPPTKKAASRWQQRLAGLLRLRLLRETGPWPAAGSKLTLSTRLGYTNGNTTATSKPILMADKIQTRQVSCHLINEHEFGGSTYDCSPMPLIVLYSLYHDHYIINIRLSSTETSNQALPEIQDLYISFISQNGHYVKVLVTLQTLFLPLVAVILAWYLHILRQLRWSYTYFQMILLLLAVALLLINCPWTYLTLVVNCPWLIILQELSLGVFYGILMTFLHFLTHLYIEPVSHCPKVRTAMMKVIGAYTATIFLLDFMENVILLHNPLPYVWESLHLGLATITVLLVVAYLTYITIKVYSAVLVLQKSTTKENTENIKVGMKRECNLHEVSCRWREMLLLMVSWICVVLTAAEFIIKRLHDGMWIWEDILGNLEIQNTSGFLLGVYSLWNVFTCMVLIMYPPIPPPNTSQGESEVTLEMPTQQQQTRLRPRPPLRRQNAIDIVSEDSVEGVTLNNPAISMDSAGGEPVKKLSVVHADGLISSDDAVSVYLIGGDSVVSATATNEALAADEDEDEDHNFQSRTISDISVPNGAVTVSNTISTNAGTSMDGVGVVHHMTNRSGGCSLCGTPALSCDSAPGNDATKSLNSLSNISNSNMDTAKLVSIKLKECKKGSMVLVNGVTIPSLDEDGSDIDMIDDMQSRSDLRGSGN
ncbi:protein wntless-like [Portunus trituberculatus]|nr:protein wntless-like [Portunus trituberculatus]